MNSFNRIIQSAWALCDICWIFIKISIHIARRPLTCFCLFTYWKLLIGYRKLVNTHIWKPTAQNVTSPFAENTSLSTKPDRRVLIVHTVYNQRAATDCTTTRSRKRGEWELVIGQARSRRVVRCGLSSTVYNGVAMTVWKAGSVRTFVCL